MKRYSFLFFAICLVVTGFLNSFSEVYAASITGKFSKGGFALTIYSSAIIVGLRAEHCDGTTTSFRPRGNIFQASWTYFGNKELKRVGVQTTNPDFDWETNQEPLIETVFKRKCNGDEPPANLFCKNVEIAHSFHRGLNEPISFKSNPFTYSAGLRLPGVDGLIWVETIAWNYGLRREQNLEYELSNRIWTGTFPSLYLPVGEYKDVWLLVFDEFGQQASCKIGKLNVLP